MANKHDNNNNNSTTADPNNPLGLGDPNDQTLRKVEKEILIPQKLRDKAKAEKCVPEVAAFTECAKNASLAMVVKCRNENTLLRACLTKWYQDEGFIATCQEEYLRERSAYRRTGVRKSSKRYEAP